MIPRPFDYHRATSVADAVAALGSREDAKAIAGGQSLVPMLSLGLLRPSLLVDLGRLELDGLESANGRVRVGALTRHRELELSGRARALLPLAAEAVAHVGNPRVRNRGTFGGSLAHADPAAELPVVAVAHDGVALVAGEAGERCVPLGDFFHGWYETALAPDEVLVAVELERLPEGSGAAFEEVAQRADDFALACAAAVVPPEGEARVVVGGAAGRPLRIDGDPDGLPDAVAAALEPADDAFVSAAHKRRVALACVRRALARAREAAGR